MDQVQSVITLHSGKVIEKPILHVQGHICILQNL